MKPPMPPWSPILTAMDKAKTAGRAGLRINFTFPGTASLFKIGAREAAKMQAPFKDKMIALNPLWGDAATVGFAAHGVIALEHRFLHGVR